MSQRIARGQVKTRAGKQLISREFPTSKEMKESYKTFMQAKEERKLLSECMRNGGITNRKKIDKSS